MPRLSQLFLLERTAPAVASIALHGAVLVATVGGLGFSSAGISLGGTGGHDGKGVGVERREGGRPPLLVTYDVFTVTTPEVIEISEVVAPRISAPVKLVERPRARAVVSPQQAQKVGGSSPGALGITGNGIDPFTTEGGGGGEVSVAPLVSPKPPYPRAARLAGFEGDVTFQVTISSTGAVDGLELLATSGRTDCDEAARRTIEERWRFAPAKKFGRPVASTRRVTVQFRLTTER